MHFTTSAFSVGDEHTCGFSHAERLSQPYGDLHAAADANFHAHASTR